MRLWSLHPSYLDSKGLVALWREGLLAQKVLQGNTNGYKNHPQLDRFKEVKNPLGAIAEYLKAVQEEAASRGYNFKKDKILKKRFMSKIMVTTGQLEYEFRHLLNKLKYRDPVLFKANSDIKTLKVHPLFRKVKGKVASWEVVY